MPVIYNENPTIDPLNPASEVIRFEERNNVFNYAFPSGIDSFGNGQKSVHAMIITANKNSTAETILDAANNPIQSIVDFFGTFDDIYDSVTNTDIFNINHLADKAKRLTESVGSFTFYMPNTVTYANANDYRDISLTSLVGDRIAQGASEFGNKGQLVGPVAGNAAGVSKYLGLPINPKIEILFENTPQREFQFDFLFAPTSPQESLALKNIIQRLRAEAAPERRGPLGILWKAPSTFDIVFTHNGIENTNIPRIQECVMTQIDIDYAPSGVWATFTNGYPTQVRMSIKLRERLPNDRDSIEEGF